MVTIKTRKELRRERNSSNKDELWALVEEQKKEFDNYMKNIFCFKDKDLKKLRKVLFGDGNNQKMFSEKEIKKILMKHLSAEYKGALTIQPEYSKIVKELFGGE